MIHPQARQDEPSTHPSLLARAAGGGPQAWQYLVQIYGPIVYRWIRRCGLQPADAADVMQDTFLAVSGALHRFDHSAADASFRGWLWTIARNKMRDLQRRQSQRQELDGSVARRKLDDIPATDIPTADGPATDDSPAAAPQPPSAVDEDSQLLRWRALQCLRQSIEPRSWQMFWETTVIGRPAGDVAQEMQVSRWAVYKARTRVLERLQRELKDLL
ncbi:RNA polymerase sigma factor [Roseimaritima sediminicola]|uniref:RNA polymerase sigma factor n=1 Tax=Roseimaritima sediminicola TaxID=2662066 RepID=UPI0012983B3A|nr:sigma-70 family RNA polymerase sigma factor [Roseimaritima sediminicola]